MGSTRKTYHWLFFLLQPFLATVYYFKNFRSPVAKNIVWVFSIYFALTIALGFESQNSDLGNYMAAVEQLYGVEMTLESSIQYYNDSQEIDVLRAILTIFVSRFTDNGYVLYVVFGVIFGYFYSRNIWFVLDRLKGKLKKHTILFFLVFCLIDPFWNMGAFRFQTGIHMFIFGLFPYLFEGNKKKLIWCFLTPVLFHYTFVLALIPLVVYLVFGNRLNLYFLLFVVTLFFNNINITRLNTVIEQNAPKRIVERTSSYRVVEKVKKVRGVGSHAGSVWYVRYLGIAFKWPIVALLVILYWNSRYYFKEHPMLYRALNFSFLFGAFASILASIPNGGRFIGPFGMLAYGLFAIYGQNHIKEKFFRWFTYGSFPLLCLYVVVSWRDGWYLTSVMTLFGNPFIAIFRIGQNTPINDVIKFFL